MTQNRFSTYKKILPPIICLVIAYACNNVRSQTIDFEALYPKQHPVQIPNRPLDEQKLTDSTELPIPIDLEADIISLATPTPNSTTTPDNHPTPVRDMVIKPDYDLFFIDDGMLKIWYSENGEIKSVIQREDTGQIPSSKSMAFYPIGNITDYVVDRRHDLVYFQRSKGITANGVELYDLGSFYLDREELTLYITDTSKLFNLALSPDGSWISYNSQEYGSGPTFAINAFDTKTIFEIGDCIVDIGEKCGSIAWSPNSQKTLWSDKRGLWLSSSPDFTPRLLIGPQLNISTLNGESETLDVQFRNFRWSPKGRYVIATARPSRSIVSWEVLIDTLRRVVVEIPGSFYDKNSASVVNWMANGRLLETQIDFDGIIGNITFFIFGIFPTNESILVKQDEFTVDTSHLEISKYTEEDNIISLELESFLIDNRNIMITIINDHRAKPSVVLAVDLKLRSTKKVCELPPGMVDQIWAPNGDQIFIMNKPQSAYYLDHDNSGIYKLNSILGENICCFSWNNN